MHFHDVSCIEIKIGTNLMLFLVFAKTIISDYDTVYSNGASGVEINV